MITFDEAMKVMEDTINTNISQRIVYETIWKQYFITFTEYGFSEDKARRESTKMAIKNTWVQYTKLTNRMRDEYKLALQSTGA